MSCAVPFLSLRLAYTLGGAFENTSATKFNPVTGSVAIFAVFSAVPEFITALIYTFAGMRIPLSLDNFQKNGPTNVNALGVNDAYSVPLIHEPQGDGRGAYMSTRSSGGDEHQKLGEYAPPMYPPAAPKQGSMKMPTYA